MAIFKIKTTQDSSFNIKNDRFDRWNEKKSFYFFGIHFYEHHKIGKEKQHTIQNNTGFKSK